MVRTLEAVVSIRLTICLSILTLSLYATVAWKILRVFLSSSTSRCNYHTYHHIYYSSLQVWDISIRCLSFFWAAPKKKYSGIFYFGVYVFIRSSIVFPYSHPRALFLEWKMCRRTTFCLTLSLSLKNFCLSPPALRSSMYSLCSRKFWLANYACKSFVYARIQTARSLNSRIKFFMFISISPIATLHK